MNDVNSAQNRVKCPFCAEEILPDARICRFCRSDLTAQPAKKPVDDKMSLGRALILNVVCPGLAAWRLGHRVRGAIIFTLVIGCLGLYAQEIVPVINKAVNVAIRTGNTRKLNGLTKELEHNRWLDLSFYVYAYSFVELVYLIKNPAGKKKDE